MEKKERRTFSILGEQLSALLTPNFSPITIWLAAASGQQQSYRN
jgi:hypothetical protein